MPDAEFRGRRLYAAFMRLKPNDLSETEWAVSAGVNRGFFTNLKNSDISPKSDTIRKLLRRIDKREADLFNDEKAAADVTSVYPDYAPTRDATAGEDMVTILSLNLSFSMGPGTTIDDYIEEMPVHFDPGYIRSFTRTPPERLRLARGVGESMFPTLASSDLVWIDTTQRMLNLQDRIWAISLFGAAAIKRLRTIGDGKIMVISDNKDVENQIVDADDLLIGGRVIRFARDV